MHYSSAFTVAAAYLAGPAAALFDSAACNGIGACTGAANCNYYPGPPSGEPSDIEWECGKGGAINGQRAATIELQFEQGLSVNQVVPKSEFPECDLIQPREGATLLKATYEGIVLYGWIEYSCTETKPITNACYNESRNPSTTYTCKVYQNGSACTHVTKKLIGPCP